jgi:hypothetical protein
MKTKKLMQKFFGLLAVGVIALATSTVSVALESAVTGTVGIIRYHTSGHANASARQIPVFQINASGCSLYWLSADDSVGLSMIIRAKKDASSVTVFYDSAVGAPWVDPSTCRVTSITLN